MRFVFGYGSLASPGSVQATLGRPLGPGQFHPADLAGWRRAWNVGSDRSSHPERTFVLDADGSEFTGLTVVLGITPSAPDAVACPGAVFAVGAGDLDLLDVRERNYERIEVTGAVTWAAMPEHRRVYTYRPRPQAVRRIADAQATGRPIAVRQGYVDLVHAAFRSTGRWAAFRATTPTIGFPLVAMSPVIDAPTGT